MSRKTNQIDGITFETTQGRTAGYIDRDRGRLCVVSIVKTADMSTRGQIEGRHWFEVRVTTPDGRVEGIHSTLPKAKKWAAKWASQRWEHN